MSDESLDKLITALTKAKEEGYDVYFKAAYDLPGHGEMGLQSPDGDETKPAIQFSENPTYFNGTEYEGDVKKAVIIWMGEM